MPRIRTALAIVLVALPLEAQEAQSEEPESAPESATAASTPVESAPTDETEGADAVPAPRAGSGIVGEVEVLAQVEEPITARFDNGLRLVTQRIRGSSSVGVCVIYGVGWGDDREGYRGLAHVVEHTMFTGSPRATDGVHAALEPHGATEIIGMTTATRTTYCEEVPVGTLDLALWVEADRMGYLLGALREEQVATQVQVVLNEFDQRGRHAPGWTMWERVSNTLYPEGHPYRHSLERPDDIRAVRVDDVRWFHQRWYSPANSTLAIVGDLTHEDVRARVLRTFGRLRGDPRPVRARPRPVALDGEHVVRTSRPRITEELHVIWPTPGWHAEGDAHLDIIGRLVTNALDERLSPREISAGGAFQYSRPGVSTFSVNLQTNPGVSAEPFLAIVDDIISELRDHPLTNGALERVKTRWTMTRTLRDQRPVNRARYLGWTTSDGAMRTIEEDLARFEHMTPESLQRAARRYLPADRRVVALGLARRNTPHEGLTRSLRR